MSNLQIVLNFMGEHPILSFLIVCSVFSWTPVKIIKNYGTKEGNEE